MRFLTTFLLLLTLATPALAASKTTVKHTTYLGGELHEACTDSVCDGIVVWKNGTMQEVHNRKRGRWFSVSFPNEAAPSPALAAGGFVGEVQADDGRKTLQPLNLGRVTPTASYMAGLMTGMLVRAGTSVIDDYVFVSPEQVTAWGGMTATANKVHLAEDAMNESFLHSGIDAQQHVVGIAQYDVHETGGWDNDWVSFYTRYNTGAFASLRTSTGFDTMTLIVKEGAGVVCGTAAIYNPAYPLHMVQADCSTANLSYAHESGHTFGMMHNVGDTGYAAVCGPTAVGYGESRFRTVMSYPLTYGPRTRQYSAPPPAVWYSDGVSAVGTSSTNATGCINTTKAIVAAWHSSVSEPPPPPAPHTAPTAVAWTRTGSPGATVAGDLTWTQTRPVDLTKYQHAVDGGGAVDDGLPATNTKSITLSSGTRTVVLSACYSDNSCSAASPLTVVVPAATAPLAYSGLSPADAAHFAKNSTVTFSVTATDDSGIASVTGYFSNKNSYSAKTTTRSNNTYSFVVKRPSGTRYWYFIIRATDGESVQTPTRSIVVP